MNLPNKLSILRLILIPFIIVSFYINFPYHYIVSCVLFAVAAFTDFLDGHIARRYNLVTDLGKFLDSSADKVLVLTTLILLLDGGLLTGDLIPSFIGGIFIIIILAREILISCLRMVTASKGLVMAADKLGKLKTILQDASIIIFLFAGEYGLNGTFYKNAQVYDGVNAIHNIFFYIGFVLFSLAVVMTLVSGIHYLVVYSGKLEGNK